MPYICWQVEIGIKQLFLGSLRGLAQSSMCDEKVKLKGWLSPTLFQEQFPDHYSEIIQSLPLREYMDPGSGILNIGARLPQEITKSDLGPSVSISYCSGEELAQANSVTNLCYGLCDMVCLSLSFSFILVILSHLELGMMHILLKLS